MSGTLGVYGGMPVYVNPRLPRGSVTVFADGPAVSLWVEYLPAFRVRVELHAYITERVNDLRQRLGLEPCRA